jgi:hypothetical protein
MNDNLRSNGGKECFSDRKGSTMRKFLTGNHAWLLFKIKYKVDYFILITMIDVSEWYCQTNVLARI